MKLKCLVFLSFLAASQAASVRHRQREIPVQVIYEEARVDADPAKTVIQRDVKEVEDVKKVPEEIKSAIQDEAIMQENTVAGAESIEDVNAIKYFSRIKNLDAKVQLSVDEQAQSIKHLPFSDTQLEIGLKTAAELTDVKPDSQPIEAVAVKADQPLETKPLDEAKPLEEAKPLKEAKPLEEAKPSESEKLLEEIKPSYESESAITTNKPEQEKDEEEEEEQTSEGQKGEEESSESVPTDLSSLLERAQEIISSGLQEIRERFKEANKQDTGAWTYLEKNVEQLFITEKEKVTMEQARHGPILQSPAEIVVVEDDTEKESARSESNPEEIKVDPVQVPAQEQVKAEVPETAPAVAQPQEPVESEKQDQGQNQNQNQNQNVIQNIINGFQNITNNFIQSFQQGSGGNGTQNEGQQGGGIGGGFVSYFTGGIQQIINNINNLGGGQPAGNGTQADTGATTQRPNLVSNFVNSFQQFIRPPGTPQGNQSDTGGGNQQQGPGGFFQGAINQFGQAVNNIFQGNRPPGQQSDTGSTQAPLPGPIQAFQNISNQIISNFNQFNPFAPSTQAPAASGDDPSTQRPTFVQNVGQVIQGLNPFRPQQEGGQQPTNPIVAGIQNANNQFQQVVGNQSFGNPVENIQNAITGVQSGSGNPIQSIQNAISGQNSEQPPADAAGDENRNQIKDESQNAIPNQQTESSVNQDSNANQIVEGNASGEALRTSGLVESSEKETEQAAEQVVPLKSEPLKEDKEEEKKQEAEQVQEVMQAVE